MNNDKVTYRLASACYCVSYIVSLASTAYLVMLL